MTIIYRILSALVNVGGVLFALCLIILLPLSLAVPPLWLPVFVMVALVLYTYTSRRFRYKVLQRNEPVKHNLRDLIRVNGFVAIVVSLLDIPSAISILANPGRAATSMQETLKQLPSKFEQNVKPETFITMSIIMLIYFVALLIHVLWTFALLKKHKEYFK